MHPAPIDYVPESISSANCTHAGSMPNASHCKIARALAAIHERLDEQWTIPALAAIAGMSRSTFALHFSTQVGMTPMRYVTSWKVAQGKQLLQDRRLSVAKVAEMLGYSSEAAFRKLFKRIEGMGPGQARAAARFNGRRRAGDYCGARSEPWD